MLTFPAKIEVTEFENSVVVFDYNSGQTHNIDLDVYDIICFIQLNSPIESSSVEEKFIANSSPEEKTLLSTYIRDIINSLVQLKLVQSVECD